MRTQITIEINKAQATEANTALSELEGLCPIDVLSVRKESTIIVESKFRDSAGRWATSLAKTLERAQIGFSISTKTLKN